MIEDLGNVYLLIGVFGLGNLIGFLTKAWMDYTDSIRNYKDNQKQKLLDNIIEIKHSLKHQY